MYGWRGRIGLIVPGSNLTCEQEMARMCPEGVITFSTRVLFESTVEGLKRMVHDVEQASVELSCENVSDLMAFCCTVGSLIEGPGHDERIIKIIGDRTGVPAITTTTAVLAALHHLGVERVAVATPYPTHLNLIEKDALEQHGFAVTGIKGIFEDVAPADFRNRMIGNCAPYEAYHIARRVDSPDAQAVFISCTNLRTIEVLDTLERDLGKPVISSNQATMWMSLRRLGILEAVRGYGSLLSS